MVAPDVRDVSVDDADDACGVENETAEVKFDSASAVPLVVVNWLVLALAFSCGPRVKFATVLMTAEKGRVEFCNAPVLDASSESICSTSFGDSVSLSKMTSFEGPVGTSTLLVSVLTGATGSTSGMSSTSSSSSPLATSS